MKSQSFTKTMPEEHWKKLPQKVVFPILNSQFFLVGHIDYINMTIENARLTQNATPGKTFSDVSTKWKSHIPQDITFAIKAKGQETPWEVSVFDLNPDTFEIEDIVIQMPGKKDFKIFKIIMANATNELDVKFDIVISEALSYAFPLRVDLKTTPSTQAGRIPKVVEQLGNGSYVGEVFFEIQFVDGKWHAWMQLEEKISSNGVLVKTGRMVRRSARSSEELALIKARGLYRPTGKFFSDPGSICANTGKDGWIQSHVIELISDQTLEKKQWKIPLTEYFHESADGLGIASAFPWLLHNVYQHVDKIQANEKVADNHIDYSTSTGYHISIGIVRMNDGSLGVIARDGEMHDRDGQIIECVTESGFNPTLIESEPIVHKLGTVDLNTKRKASTSTTAGLHPVLVYEYQEGQLPKDIVIEEFDDVKQNGDGRTWIALSMYLWHLYGEQVEHMDLNQLKSLARD